MLLLDSFWTSSPKGHKRASTILHEIMPPRKRAYPGTGKPGKATKSKENAKRQHTEASHTLYLSNLNTKIKPHRMKENLYVLFTSFADVLEINYPRKNFRGQGWIVVTSPDDANECLAKLEGFDFFDQPLHVRYARKDSNIIHSLKKLEDATLQT